jgi:signal transduction histidine kinase
MKIQKLKQRIFDEFNLKKQADDLGLRVWQTPSFLFIMMGVVIVAAMTAVDFVAQNYDSPNVLIISEALVVSILLIIGYFIIHDIEEVAHANKIKTEFVSVASHQLKTPIAEIKWQLELLLSKFSQGMTPKQKEILHEIMHSGERMARLVNDLLDVAHIDQGRLPLAKEYFDLCQIVDESIREHQSMAEVSGADLSKSCPIKKQKIFADKRRVLVVLDNLLSNAIKYTEGKGKVEIFLEPHDDEVQVCIRDNGVGIPKNEQDRIFEKFFRSNNSIKNKTDGTGLGLYIAKNIIEQSGGRIWFQSDENIGSEFYFTLPLEKVPAK